MEILCDLSKSKGSYLYEPAHSVHTLTVSKDGEGADVWFAIYGANVNVDADGNVYAAEGPNSLRWAGGAFTKYGVSR